jgi:hypothetical protein
MYEIEGLFSEELTKLTNKQLNILLKITTDDNVLKMFTQTTDDNVLKMFTQTTKMLKTKDDNDLTTIFDDLILAEVDDKARRNEHAIKKAAIHTVSSNVEVVSNIEKSAKDIVNTTINKNKSSKEIKNAAIHAIEKERIKNAAIHRVSSNVEVVSNIEKSAKDIVNTTINKNKISKEIKNAAIDTVTSKTVGVTGVTPSLRSPVAKFKKILFDQDVKYVSTPEKKYERNKDIDLTLKLTTQVDEQIKESQTNLVKNFYNEYLAEIRICKLYRRKKFGIENTWNQCYSNAFFQMLYSMPAMRQIFTTSEINDENDTIGLLVKRFTYIRHSISHTNYVIRQDIDKPPTESTCLVKYFPNYKNQQDPAEIFDFIVDAIELRIYKYVLNCYNKDIDHINSLSELDTKAEFKEVEQTINKKWAKIQTCENKLTRIYNLYVKFIEGTITNDEKKILFNNNEPHQYILRLKHFTNSITHNQITHYVCEQNKQIVQRNITVNEKIIQLPLKHNTDNNENYCKSIQESINAFQEIEQPDTSEWSHTDSCKGTFYAKYTDNKGKQAENIYNVKKKFIHLKTLEKNKYIIIQLKRFSKIDETPVKDTRQIFVDKQITISKYDKFNVEKELNKAINKVIDINGISDEEKDILYTDIGNIMNNMHQIPITYQSQSGGDFFIPYLDKNKTFIDDLYTYINTPNEDKYTLTGVICHSESTSISSGHYFYYEYDHNGDIKYCYEDVNVNELQDGEFVEAKEEEGEAKEEDFSNLTDEDQIKIAINKSTKKEDKVKAYYINKKAAEEHIEKNGYIFLYSRYPVDQYNPEKTEQEITVHQRDELAWEYDEDILIETEKTVTVDQLNEQVEYVSNSINKLNKQIEEAVNNYKLIKTESNYNLITRLEKSKTYLLNRSNRLKKLIKKKVEKEDKEKVE